MLSLKSGALLKTQPLQQQHADILELLASRHVVVARREQPQGTQSRSSLCSKSSCRNGWTAGWKQTQLLELNTGLKRSSSAEKRFHRVPRLKDNYQLQCVWCVSDLTSSSSDHVLHDSSSESSFYRRFVDYVVQECSCRLTLEPFPMQNEFRKMMARDGKSFTCSYAFQSDKIRNIRAADVDGGSSIQVLNLVAFPSAAYDLPFFCADLVTFKKNHLIVLDFNPLYNSLDLPRQYKETYINPLYPIWNKYKEVLPWGGEMSSESLEFLSPYVIWSRPIKDPYIDEIVFEAFKDYLHVWLDLVDKAEASSNVDEIRKNQESQHRYMVWRSTKDPGRNLLTRLYGETQCEDYMKGFLFADMDNLGRKSFLDYFPKFRDPNGSVVKKRSVSGKGYPTRPWDEDGNYVGSTSA
ncbi:unnamed protein product [Calypogeia fissa]